MIGFEIAIGSTQKVLNVATDNTLIVVLDPGNHQTWVNSKPGTSMSKCAKCLSQCNRSDGQW